MKNSAKIIFMIATVILFNLIGCASYQDQSLEADFRRFEQLQEPTPGITRTADMPLVAAIPGLNLPMAPVGAAQFGDLTQMLEHDGIPSFVVAYDEKIHPLSSVSGLYSEEYSIAATRVLPILSNAIVKENEIRRAQNIPDLRELVLVSYSQGSVLALDVLRGFLAFRQEWLNFKQQVGGEWIYLKRDPEFELLRNSIANFLLLDKIRIERRQELQRSYDFQRFYRKLSQDSTRANERFKTYLGTPEEIFSEDAIISRDSPGYPRQYPAIQAWLEQHYPNEEETTQVLPDFWVQYVEYEQLLPLQLRLFSMAGSFFGAAGANVGYGLIKILPNKGEDLLGPVAAQIRDTQLGTRYHLEVIKGILAYSQQVGPEKAAQNIYFIIGVNGNKGDGLIDQYSAHFSSHLFTRILLGNLLADSEDESLVFPHDRLPAYPLTGLKVHHLPHRELLFFDKPGVAQMDSQSEVYPYLLAFIRKNVDELGYLHESQNQKMRQFMVVVDLPVSGEIDHCKFNLTGDSNQLKITGRFYNQTSHAMVWTGIFTSDQIFYSPEDLTVKHSANVVLKISKLSEHEIDVNLVFNPGVCHFVEISTTQRNKQYDRIKY